MDLAKERIDGIDTAVSTEDLSVTPSKRDLPRVPLGSWWKLVFEPWGNPVL